MAGWWATEYVYLEGNTICSNRVTNKNEAAASGITFFCNGTIINNRIMDNITHSETVWGEGGGILCLGYDDIFISVDVIDNHVENNRVLADGSGDIRAYGGGLQFAGAKGTIQGNKFIGNKLKSS